MVLPMIGADTLTKLNKNVNGRFKKLLTPLLKDGIGDKMDKGNLWIVPGFTVLAFAVLWTTKLSKLALDESTCKGASIYDLSGTTLDADAQRHCQTAKRYYVEINEPFHYDQKWRESRQVKNPEWILWFWAPIVFVMYVLTRYLWSLLMENQGINFNNVVNASQNVTTEYEGITEVDEEKLYDKISVISDNFRCALSSNAFAAFICFETILVLAPLLLLMGILPLLIGGHYRTWGLDVAKAWWDNREWQGSPLQPFFNWRNDSVVMPLVPRYTYCDFHFVTLGNDHVLTYRCYLDANWHERTALFTWIMLTLLTFINFLNLLFWILWAIRMKNSKSRRKWVMKKWLLDDDFQPDDKELIEKFAKTFKMGNLLLFYYIEAHTDRVVASAFAKGLFCKWMDKFQQEIDESFRVNVLHQHHLQPTAPPLTPETDTIGQTTAVDKPPIAWPKLKSEEVKDNIGWKNTTPIESGIEESGPSTSSIATSTQNSEIPISAKAAEPSVTPSKNSRFYRPNISLKTNSKIDPMNSLKLPKEKKKQTEKTVEEKGEENQDAFYNKKKCTIT